MASLLIDLVEKILEVRIQPMANRDTVCHFSCDLLWGIRTKSYIGQLENHLAVARNEAPAKSDLYIFDKRVFHC